MILAIFKKIAKIVENQGGKMQKLEENCKKLEKNGTNCKKKNQDKL